jgi:hypothetical protein
MTPGDNPDRIEAMLTRQFRTTQADEAAAARVMDRLSAAKLPSQLQPQRRRLRWPALFDLDFSPIWPRVAALGACAALGFVLGFAGFDARVDEASATATMAAVDLPSYANDIEPLTGLRP